MPTIDVDSLKAGAATIMTNADTLKKSSGELAAALPELQKQLKSIEDAEGVLAQAVKYINRKCRPVKCRYAGTEQCDRNTAW